MVPSHLEGTDKEVREKLGTMGGSETELVYGPQYKAMGSGDARSDLALKQV